MAVARSVPTTSASVSAFSGWPASGVPLSTWSQVAPSLWHVAWFVLGSGTSPQSGICERSSEESAVDPTGVEPTGRSSSPVEPTGVEPTGVEPTGVEPTGVEPTGVDPTGVEPTGVDPTGVDPTGVEPTGLDVVEPAKNESQAFGMLEIGTWSIPAPALEGVTLTFRFDSGPERAAP